LPSISATRKIRAAYEHGARHLLASQSSKSMPKSLFEKIWDAHLVAKRMDGRDLIYVDRHVLHELHAPHAFESLEKQSRPVRRPDLTFSMQDHTVATKPGRTDSTNPDGAAFLRAMREGSRKNRIRIFDLDDPEQGISHVVAPELGMVLPGATHAVPDSHASTVGGLGALAFGCGTTELAHILATQVMALKRPKSMRIRLDGKLGPQVSAKDVALRIIAQLGVSGGRGFVVEYAGATVRAMPIEQRMTLCNLNIEMGGRSGFVAPDGDTFTWLAGRPWAPQGADWDRALAHWRTLKSDDDAAFDSEPVLDCGALEPQITWGTDPSQVVGISGRVPDPAGADQSRRAALESALTYMGLQPGKPLVGLAVNRVFIGSCTNARLPDLEAAAAVVRGRRVADGIVALVVPGSSTVKRAAEAKGLDRVFRDAGFSWGESGCSMCAGGNGDRGEPGERVVSTTNRNFENRQGPKVRTHLASPATAAAAAVTGRITDVRQLLAGNA
jgi:3-isopropylmalate/(R)-2-methylmalate dehydratase large subunit